MNYFYCNECPTINTFIADSVLMISKLQSCIVKKNVFFAAALWLEVETQNHKIMFPSLPTPSPASGRLITNRFQLLDDGRLPKNEASNNSKIIGPDTGGWQEQQKHAFNLQPMIFAFFCCSLFCLLNHFCSFSTSNR